MSDFNPVEFRDETIRDYKARIRELEAEVERLRGALKKIEATKVVGVVEDMKHSQAHLYHEMRKIARAALNP